MSNKAIEETAGKWQNAMGLGSWTIRVDVVQKDWRKSGDIKVDANNRLAVLMVNEAVALEHLDEVVVHELVHLKLHALDRMMEDLLNGLYGEDEEDGRRRFAHAQFMDALETTTQDLTRALLSLAGAFEPMMTPSVERRVDGETTGPA